MTYFSVAGCPKQSQGPLVLARSRVPPPPVLPLRGLAAGDEYASVAQHGRGEIETRVWTVGQLSPCSVDVASGRVRRQLEPLNCVGVLAHDGAVCQQKHRAGIERRLMGEWTPGSRHCSTSLQG